MKVKSLLIIFFTEKFTDYILPLLHVFSLTKTSNDIVLKLFQSLPLNKASGLDDISAKLLKVRDLSSLHP